MNDLFEEAVIHSKFLEAFYELRTLEYLIEDIGGECPLFEVINIMTDVVVDVDITRMENLLPNIREVISAGQAYYVRLKEHRDLVNKPESVDVVDLFVNVKLNRVIERGRIVHRLYPYIPLFDELSGTINIKAEGSTDVKREQTEVLEKVTEEAIVCLQQDLKDNIKRCWEILQSIEWSIKQPRINANLAIVIHGAKQALASGDLNKMVVALADLQEIE